MQGFSKGEKFDLKVLHGVKHFESSEKQPSITGFQTRSNNAAIMFIVVRQKP